MRVVLVEHATGDCQRAVFTWPAGIDEVQGVVREAHVDLGVPLGDDRIRRVDRRQGLGATGAGQDQLAGQPGKRRQAGIGVPVDVDANPGVLALDEEDRVVGVGVNERSRKRFARKNCVAWLNSMPLIARSRRGGAAVADSSSARTTKSMIPSYESSQFPDQSRTPKRPVTVTLVALNGGIQPDIQSADVVVVLGRELGEVARQSCDRADHGSRKGRQRLVDPARTVAAERAWERSPANQTRFPSSPSDRAAATAPLRPPSGHAGRQLVYSCLPPLSNRHAAPSAAGVPQRCVSPSAR